MKNLKPTPLVTLRLGGYNDMTQQMLPVFSKVKNLLTLEEKITWSRRLLPYCWKFEGQQKNFRLRKYMTVTKSGSMKFWVIRKDSGLKSGSRDVIPLKLSNIRFTIRFKGNLSPTKLWSSQIRFKNFRFKKELTSRKFELKGRQKISGWKWIFRFTIRFKKNLSLAKS